ncbi:MAG: alpha/beta fold hydrolase, partial [Pseudomonadota bacterium]
MSGVGRWLVAIAGSLAVALAVWQLEQVRQDVRIDHVSVGSTPVTVYQRTGVASAPAVIITHGFAGSRQLMEGYALTLARAGYISVSFDFEGHGRNPTPMSGDVTRIDGTTQRLMTEIGRVTDYALRLPNADGRIALLGHSMASDIIVRQAKADQRAQAVIAISMFSQAVTATEPRNLLAIAGEWETFLRGEALEAARMVNAEAKEGETIGSFEDGTARRVVVAPSVEHVAVLYSPTALKEARNWLDRVFEYSGPIDARPETRGSEDPAPAVTGPWIVLLLVGIVALAWPATRLLPVGKPAPSRQVSVRTFLVAALLPAVLTPLLLAPFDTRFLPILVADYLALHLLVYGLIVFGVLWLAGVGPGRLAWLSGLALAAYGIFIFGGVLDRYVASFMPTVARIPIVLAIAIGSVPFMIADSLLAKA